nr:MAG TPA: hypothetical protein [Crassvirales sp.]
MYYYLYNYEILYLFLNYLRHASTGVLINYHCLI